MTWIQLNVEQEDEAWREFYKQFKFNPSVHYYNFPGIEEPAPSVTYSISECYNSDEDSSSLLEKDLTLNALTAFQKIVAVGEVLLVLDWHHQCFYFDPHAVDILDPEADWLIPVLPNGEYSIFTTKDFGKGTFGHPWEQTICVFGQSLMDAFELRPPLLFADLLRRDGKSIKQFELQPDPDGTVLKVYVSSPSETTYCLISNILSDLKRAFYEKNRLSAFYFSEWAGTGYMIYIGDQADEDDLTALIAIKVVSAYSLPIGSKIIRKDL